MRISSVFDNLSQSCLICALSSYLPIRLNPRGGHQTRSGEPSAGGGGSFLCAMLVLLVVSERSQCLPYNPERQAR